MPNTPLHLRRIGALLALILALGVAPVLRAQDAPTEEPTVEPVVVTEEPTTEPVITEEPTTEPVITEEPTTEPVITEEPTTEPVVVTEEPTAEPTTIPDALPFPDAEPTVAPEAWAGPVAPQAADLAGAGLRAPAGVASNTTQGFDLLGVNPWHTAGFTGAGLKIAVLDFGFGPSATVGSTRLAELTCLATHPTVSIASGFGGFAAGDTTRGLDMAEVICDIAPAADVTLYKTNTTTRLYNAIVQATGTHQVIVIGADFGASFSPGDGTFGRTSTTDVYAALQAAKNAGTIVIAAAGNTRDSYKTFTYNGGASNLVVTARPGQTVDISWSDWNTTAPTVDLTASLSGDGFSALAKPARISTDNPAYQWVVPSNCTLAGDYCQNLVLSLNGVASGPTTVQVSVSGSDSSLGDPSGGGLVPNSGSLARPADSPNVITVGAVCNDRAASFPELLDLSSTGPIMGAGGTAPTLPNNPFNASNVKPDLASLSHVNTALNFNNVACEDGFIGTQAAAAHIAGLATLLRQNTLNGALTTDATGATLVNNVANYLRTRSVDLPLDLPNGYDFATGAGLATLGSPTYDSDGQFNYTPGRFSITHDLLLDPCTSRIYVGQHDAGSPLMNGTVDAPFSSLAYAMSAQSQAGGTKPCVVVLPGEYVTPYLITNATHPQPFFVYGYNTITSDSAAGNSEIYVNNVYEGTPDIIFRTRSAGVFFENSTAGVTWQGFRFTGAQAGGQVIAQKPPRAVSVAGSTDIILSENIFTSFPTGIAVPLVEVFGASNDILISENTFANLSLSNSPGAVHIDSSGTTTNKIIVRGNTFTGITNNTGNWAFPRDPSNAAQGSSLLFFTPTFSTLDSYTSLENNTFTRNNTRSVIQFLTRAKDSAAEAYILGNAIVGNTLSTDNAAYPAGPVINGYHGPIVYIVNNTIANNTTSAADPFNKIIARGDHDEFDVDNGFDWNGSLATEARWEVHNNLVFNNTGFGTFVGDTDVDFNQSGCINLGSTANAGATHNWVYGTTAALAGGTCEVSLQSNNNVRTDPISFLVGGTDTFAPAYYAFSGIASEPNGIDDGNDGVLTGVLSFYGTGRDLRGANRRIDGDGNNSVLGDIGAFELPGSDYRFGQLTPANGVFFTTAPTTFTWQEAAVTGEVYDFVVSRLVSGISSTVLSLPNLTPAPDADGLSCISNLCTLTLTSGQSSTLGSAGSIQSWDVSVDDTVLVIPSRNGPFTYELPDGTVLPLLNTSFETQGGSAARFARNWATISTQSNDRRYCNGGFAGTSCYFRLQGTPTDLNNRVTQTITRTSSRQFGRAGQTLKLVFYARTNDLLGGRGTVTIRATFASGATQQQVVYIPSSRPFRPFIRIETSMLLTAQPVSITIEGRLRGRRGYIDFDQFLLTLK